MARVWSSTSVMRSTPGLSRLQRYYMARVWCSTSFIHSTPGFVALAAILYGACVFLYLSDTLYAGFVALATILHGAYKILNRGVYRKSVVSQGIPEGCLVAGYPKKGAVSQGVPKR